MSGVVFDTDAFSTELDKLVEARFRFLVDEWRFKRSRPATTDWTYSVRYKGQYAGVEVCFDYTEEDLVVDLVKLKRWLFWRGFPLGLPDPETRVGVDELAARRGGPRLNRAERERRLDLDYIDGWLKEAADAVRSYAADLLRGDFTEFDAVIAEFREASARGPIYPYRKTSTPPAA
jgi:hypothetical protein